MQIVLSCGQYTIRIEGPEKLLDPILPQWKKYQAANKVPNIVFRIVEGIDACSVHPVNGWSIHTDGESKQVLYSSKGNPDFALVYSSPVSKMTLQISEGKGGFLKIGILYGLLLTLHTKSIGLHGVTLLCGNEIFILSAPSGTGKTTLAHLLETYCDASVINGDFALLTPTENGVIFEPTPFCGSSGRCLNHRVRVNRVVFLEQGKTNEWQKLEEREATIRFMSNAFVPTWDGGMQQAVQENILKCISMLKVNLFSFAPTQEAAEMFLNQLSPQ
ncbi:MAG: hypothetical protein K5919_07240 [Clostridiales bacterium]|nr:hypothetical protein [Clostridiales bacterium]